jgi:hypothetical protein
VTLSLAVAFALLAAPASAAPTTTLTVSATLLSQPKGKPWQIGVGVAVTIANPDGSQPSPLRHLQIKFPRGAKTNFGAFPACSQKRLEARKSPDGCPAASRIGKGTAKVSAIPIFPDPVVGTIDVFNGPRKGRGRTLLFLARSTTPISVQFVFSGTLRPATGRFGYILDVDVPRIPTIPGVPDAAPVAFETLVQARRGGISYIDAPTSCPKAGLPFQGTFTFADGSTSTAAAHIGCTLTSTPG